MRFAVTTLGCKANQFDTGTITDILCRHGFKHVEHGERADVCIINTCCVTAESVRKSRQAIRKMKKSEPNALIAVCGCSIKLDSNDVQSIGIDLTGGTDDREEFAKRIIKTVGATTLDRPRNQATSLPTSRTRALLKIQDGCDNHCTYCIIPHVRGKSQSMPLDEMAEKARSLQEEGYKEIVITGIEISSWQSKKIVALPLLLEAITTISKAAPKARLRLGSLDPQILSEDFIFEMSKIPNLCNHFHISLQSGCDEILKRMGRRYNTAQVREAIKSLRSNIPDCAVTADLIVGFPGETDEEFDKTIEFIQKAAFSDMHIFPYSIRPGTAAETMPGQLDKSIKQKRALAAKQAAEQMKLEFMKSQIAKTVTVLFEEKKGNYSIGHSSNYMKIATHDNIAKNTLKNVKIVSTKDGLLLGEIV